MVREGVPANRNCLNKSPGGGEGQGTFLGMEDDARTERVREGVGQGRQEGV